MNIKILASSSTGNCYYIDDGKAPLLLDCGISINRIKQGLDFKLSSVVACLITHEHQDHAVAVKNLMAAGIDCYMSKGTAEALELGEYHRLKIVEAKKQFTVKNWQVVPFDTEHDAAEPLGFLCASGGEKLLYVTDTYYCRYKFQGLTHILVECNYSKDLLEKYVAQGKVHPGQKQRLLHSHFELGNVKEFLKANDLSKVEAIYLIHMSNGNADAPRFKKEIQAVTGKPVYVA